MMTIKITKQQLLNVLKRWAANEVTTGQMQMWMLDNFEPDEFVIGEGESEHTVEAMHIVMNEYELADERKCLQSQSGLATAFIEASATDFLSARNAFLQRGFCD